MADLHWVAGPLDLVGELAAGDPGGLLPPAADHLQRRRRDGRESPRRGRRDPLPASATPYSLARTIEAATANPRLWRSLRDGIREPYRDGRPRRAAAGPLRRAARAAGGGGGQCLRRSRQERSASSAAASRRSLRELASRRRDVAADVELGRSRARRADGSTARRAATKRRASAGRRSRRAEGPASARSWRRSTPSAATEIVARASPPRPLLDGEASLELSGSLYEIREVLRERLPALRGRASGNPVGLAVEQILADRRALVLGQRLDARRGRRAAR